MKERINPGAVAAAAFVLVALLVAGCWPGLGLLDPYGRNDLRMRAELSQIFPGFRVTRLEYDNSDVFLSDGGRSASYMCELESEDVPGFKVLGRFYLTRAGGPQGWGGRSSMFDGRGIPRAKLVELERLWVAAFPGEKVGFGDDTLSGQLSKADAEASDFVVAEQYASVPRDEVYCLEGGPNELEGFAPGQFFRLDSRSGKWSRLVGYARPSWQ